MSADSFAMSTAAVHRDADVRGLERETVVDAVAEKADDVAFRMQRGDDARLLLRRTLAKTVTVSTSSANSPSVMASISEPSAMRSISRPTSRQILRVTISLSPVRILTATPESLSDCEGGADALLGRVEKSDEAEQRQAAFVRDRIARLGAGDLFIGDCHDAKPIRVERPRFLPRLFPRFASNFRGWPSSSQ